MYKIIPGLTGILLCFSVLAQDTGFTADLCERNAETCDQLAVEVVRLELVEQISLRRSRASSNSLLCPTGERCCANGSEAQCRRLEAALVGEAQMVGKVQGRASCPMPFLHPDLCDAMNKTCERGEIYLPWSGCTPRLVIEIPPIPLPPYCEEGTEWNGKICIPVPCYTQHFGMRFPCQVFGEHLNHLATGFARSEGDDEHPLRARLVRPVVRERAIEQLRQELEAALRELELIAREN